MSTSTCRFTLSFKCDRQPHAHMHGGFHTQVLSAPNSICACMAMRDSEFRDNESSCTCAATCSSICACAISHAGYRGRRNRRPNRCFIYKGYMHVEEASARTAAQPCSLPAPQRSMPELQCATDTLHGEHMLHALQHLPRPRSAMTGSQPRNMRRRVRGAACRVGWLLRIVVER
jgi:hypothetical protein